MMEATFSACLRNLPVARRQRLQAPSVAVCHGARAGSCSRRRQVSVRAQLSEEGGVSRRAAVALSVGAAIVGAPLLAGPAFAKPPPVVELTPQNFSTVVGPGKRVFVEMYAPWCPFCKRLEEDWSELPKRLQDTGVNDTTIAKMDVDKYTTFAQRYSVSGFPTMILFEDGKPVGMHQGFVGAEALLRYASARPGQPGQALQPGPKLDLVLNERSQVMLMDEIAQLRAEIKGNSGPAALRRLDTLELLLGGGPPAL